MFGLIWIAVGIWVLGCAASDNDEYLTHPRTRLVSMVLGRTGARWFYGLAGIGMAGTGVGFLLGLIQ